MGIKIFKFIMVCCCVTLLSGCWDSKELDQRAMIGGIGIDIGENDSYQVISQIIPSEAAKAALAGPSPGDPELIWNLTTEGDTVVKALFNTTAITGRDPSFSHTRVIIISEKLAKQGIEGVLDFLRRSEELRRRSWLLITDEDLEEVFNSKNKLTIIPSYGLGAILQDGDLNADIAAVNLHEFSKKVACESSSAYAPMVAIHELGVQEPLGAGGAGGGQGGGSGSVQGGGSQGQEQKELVISETAVFEEFKFKGKLDEKETRGLLFIEDNIRSTIVSTDSPNNPDKNVEVVVNTLRTRVKPVPVDGSFIMNIRLRVDGFISENHDSELSTSKPEVLEKIAEQVNKTITEEITASIKKAQSLKADIFDFGDAIHKNFPKEWKEMEENWPEEFAKLEFELEFDTNIIWGGRIETEGKKEK